MSNAIENLMPDEKLVLDKYRKARAAKHASVELHIQDGRLVHINVTEKTRPDFTPLLRPLKETPHAS